MNADQLPTRMRSKIVFELCPVPGLPGFCWTWTGALNSRGYGCWGVDGKSQLTHRVAYKLLVGEIPTGLQIDHLCQNKRCCNPAHLEPVTDAVNKSRTEQATKLRCTHGHPLVAPNLIIKARKGGGAMRNCRTCAMDSRREKRGSDRPRKGFDKRRAEMLAEAEAALRDQLAGRLEETA